MEFEIRCHLSFPSIGTSGSIDDRFQIGLPVERSKTMQPMHSHVHNCVVPLS